MPYALSAFSEHFLDYCQETIIELSEHKLREIAQEVLGHPADTLELYLQTEQIWWDIYDQMIEINTVTKIEAHKPVEIWLDALGHYTLLIKTTLSTLQNAIPIWKGE